MDGVSPFSSCLPSPISNTGFIGSLNGQTPLLFLKRSLHHSFPIITPESLHQVSHFMLKLGSLLSLEILGALPQNQSKVSAPMLISLNTSFLYIQYIWSYIHLYIYIHISLYTHTYIYTYTYIYRYVYIYTFSLDKPFTYILISWASTCLLFGSSHKAEGFLWFH